MAQKMQKIETFGLSRERQKANTDSMSSALSAILQLMVQENKMADKHKLELLKGYNDSLRTVVTRFSSGNMFQWIFGNLSRFTFMLE